MRAALLLLLGVSAGLSQEAELAEQSRSAKALMAAGRFADAIPIYQELCRALPANPGLRLNLALAFHMAGRDREAIPEFERVLKSDPANQPALISLGAALLGQGSPGQAIAPLTKAVAGEPRNTEVRGMLANALLSAGRAGEAAPQFRKLTAVDPQDPKAWFGLGRSYEALAQAAFDELNRSAEGSAEWLMLLADSRMERRQFRSAFYFYKEVAAKAPAFPGVHAGLAEVYRRTGHPDWASAEQLKEDGTPKRDCTSDKGACDFAAGRLLGAVSAPSPYWRARAANELARQAFERLGALPPSVELHAIKAEILTSQGNALEAAQEWRAAQRLAPDDPAIARQLATAVYLAKDYQGAVPMLQKLIGADPRAADLHYFLGDCLLHLDQPEEAIPELQLAVGRNPKLLPAHASLGLALVRTGKIVEAIPHLKAALEIDDDGSLHYQLARAYQRTGNAALADATLAKYRELEHQSDAQKKELEQKAEITPP